MLIVSIIPPAVYHLFIIHHFKNEKGPGIKSTNYKELVHYMKKHKKHV